MGSAQLTVNTVIFYLIYTSDAIEHIRAICTCVGTVTTFDNKRDDPEMSEVSNEVYIEICSYFQKGKKYFRNMADRFTAWN